MAKIASVLQRIEPLLPRDIGLVASLVGGVGLLVYPLAPAGIIPAELVPGGDPLPLGGRQSSHPLVVYLSAIGGSVLLTWGAFTLRHRSITPLTPRRALLAPLLSVLTIVAGVGRFTYEWVRVTPFNVYEGDRVQTVDPPLLEIIRLELTGVQFVALAAVSMMVVGAVTAQYSRRAAIASAFLPTALAAISLADFWSFHATVLTTILATAALAIVPFAVGYIATRRE